MAESVPPLLPEHLRSALETATWASYVVRARATERAWKVAVFLETLMAGVRVYRVADGEVLHAIGLPRTARGVAIGPGMARRKALRGKAVDDLMLVAKAVEEVRA